MKQEDKKLLLIDLCARLPYGAKVWYSNGSGAISTVKGIVDDICYFNENPKYGNFCRIETVKPYLRPMSSMTDEEREEWTDLFMKPICELEQYVDEKEAQDLAPILYGKSHSVSIDWLNKNHFDYYGLIPMGLALEAPEGLYKEE